MAAEHMSCGIDGSANFCAIGALNYEQNVLHQYWQLCNLLQSEPLKAFFFQPRHSAKVRKVQFTNSLLITLCYVSHSKT